MTISDLDVSRIKPWMPDRDCSFAPLDGVSETDQLSILKTPPHAPLCNAYAERHVREIRETLDQIILLGRSTCAAPCVTLWSIITGEAQQ